MALPPSSDVNETFLREVDENLRRDRIRDFFAANKGALIAALILFLGISGGLIWWQEHKREVAGSEVEQLAQIYKDIGQNKVGQATVGLDKLSDSSSDAVRASALFTRAAVAIQQNDTALASKKYGEIIADGSLPQPYHDAALLRQTALDFDKLKPDEVINRLAPLAKPDSPWFGSAAELTGAAMIKQGRKLEAGKLFAQIAAAKNVPEPIRARSVQIAGTLGVDASGALPPPPAAQ